MAEPETMISWSGTQHKVGRRERRAGYNGRGYWRLWAACNSSLTEFSNIGQDEPPQRNCKRCFPPTASLGAASTIHNPPPGEHRGETP